MTAHLPFARKYRPQTFDELVGQPHVTETLSRALKQKRVAQAYLFAGQRGVGKTSAARILAKCLNCEKGPTASPCQACAGCTQITLSRSLDVIEIDGASNRGIDEIRSLRETIPYAPAIGGFRVYIIDEVHMLTTEAFNALLKTLEEPPAHVKFIFATTAPNKIPATILSRCQRFDFRRLEASAIVEALRPVAKTEALKIDETALYAVARAAEGSLRDAEVTLEQLASFVEGSITEDDVTELMGAVGSEALFSWAQAILDHQPAQALAHLTEQLDQGKDPAQLLSSLVQHLRNLLIVRSVGASSGGSAEPSLARLIDEPADRLARLGQQAGCCDPQELLFMLQIANGAYEMARRSPMAQTILEMALLKLSTREQWRSLEHILQRLDHGLGSAPAQPGTQSRSGHVSAGSASLAAGSSTRSGSAPGSMTPAPQPQPSASASSVPPTPSRALDGSVTGLAEVWPVFLQRLGTQKMSLAAFLAESRPLRLERQLLTIGLPGFALHQEILTDLEPKRLIERLLSELCQQPVTVAYETLLNESALTAGSASPSTETASEAGAMAAGGGPPIVQDIVKLFNATVVDRPRPAT